MRNTAIFLLVFSLVACSGGGGGSGGGNGRRAGSPLLLAAGMRNLPSETRADWTEAANPGRLGIDTVDRVYDVTTPAGQPFVFDVLSRREGNAGAVTVSIAHAVDGAVQPDGGPTTLAEAGIIPMGSGTNNRGLWLEANGDGFARITVRGAVERDQVLAVTAEAGARKETALIRIRIGEKSEINAAASADGAYAGVLDRQTIYSSDSWSFGLPTVAVSGDRTSIVCYEGDRADPRNYGRFEMRLQHQSDSGAVTGGATLETSPDSGHWRDHEIAALFNVLATVHSGREDVVLRISMDRGATFAQTETLASGEYRWRPRLATISMALDYTLAVVYWRGWAEVGTDLVLVTGRPSAFDGTGSPTEFEFDPEVILFRDEGDVTPLLMSSTWSLAGDLVVGYGFSRITTRDDGAWVSTTQNRCLVKPWGKPIQDTLVDEEKIIGRDPSVAVLGGGDALRIFYAYEASDGVRLTTSDDGGRTFAAPIPIGGPEAHTPTVLVRDQGGAARTDVLYLVGAPKGTELHLAHWNDFDKTKPTQYALTEAKMTETRKLDRDAPAPGAGVGILPPDVGYRMTQVAWFGYDAVVDGDDVVVVYDEETVDAYTICWGAPEVREGGGGGSWAAFDDAAPGFVAADPPPLAPGLTEPVEAPDPDDMHQLKLLRLD